MIKIILKKVFYNVSKILPDKTYLKLKFRKNLGYFPNFKNPTTFCEKIQWLKLNERHPIQVICADKYLVRNFIAENLGEQYLIPLLFQTYNPRDIIPKNLPDVPFIIKTNHDSGGVIIVKNKKDHNWVEVQQYLDKKLKTNYYFLDREWPYKKIKPCIIVEKLLLDKSGNIPFDFKVHRFNGIAKFIQVDKNRGKLNHSRFFFNTNWEIQDFTVGDTGGEKDSNIPKPISLNKMIVLSESILKEFSFLRIDWYDVDGKLYLGEITFQPGGGFDQFKPLKWEKIIGNFINLKA